MGFSRPQIMEILKSQDKKLKFTGIAVENEELWSED